MTSIKSCFPATIKAKKESFINCSAINMTAHARWKDRKVHLFYFEGFKTGLVRGVSKWTAQLTMHVNPT